MDRKDRQSSQLQQGRRHSGVGAAGELVAGRAERRAGLVPQVLRHPPGRRRERGVSLNRVIVSHPSNRSLTFSVCCEK